MTLTIEVLYPEIANLHGDLANITYLAQCRPDARIIHTELTQTPAFATGDVDLLYLGPLTEHGQGLALDRLRPYRDHLEARITDGGVSLFTHNALELLGTRIVNDDMGYELSGLDLVDLETRVEMFGRYNGKVMGAARELGTGHPVLGYKSQFSMVTAGPDVDGFITADRGIGRNRSTTVEGVRRNNLIGTSLIGPLLVVNPHFTRALLAQLDADTEPVLAHEALAVAAYDARLADFGDARRWHDAERVLPARR